MSVLRSPGSVQLPEKREYSVFTPIGTYHQLRQIQKFGFHIPSEMETIFIIRAFLDSRRQAEVFFLVDFSS